MEREDKITENNIETPRSDVVRLRAKLTEEVVCMKNRHQGSAASGSGSAGNFATRVMQNTFVASRVELKGWRAWRNIRGTGITLSEGKELSSDTKARVKLDDLNKFDWERTDRDQGNFDIIVDVSWTFKISHTKEEKGWYSGSSTKGASTELLRNKRKRTRRRLLAGQSC